MGNQSNYYQQGPAKSGSVSNLGGALGTSPPTITYDIDASPAQLAGAHRADAPESRSLFFAQRAARA